ncbi:MAG: hypothetical protein LLF96_07150 [Eubacteriales bacterium]|nr:hypothetical protein [Eubacteriales bacterium]
MPLASLGYSTAPSVGSGVALVIALTGAIMIAIFFFNPKNKDRYTGWWQKLYAHVNFDRFLLTSILKFLYSFGALYAIVYGLILMFSGSVLSGLAMLVLAPIALRVAFEQLLLLLSIRRETAEMNDLLRRMQGLPPRSSGKSQTPVAPTPSQPSDPRYGGQPSGYSGQGYGSYPQQQRPAQGNDGGMTQRYAPVRPGEYGAPSGQGNTAGYRRPSAGRNAAPTESAPSAADAPTPSDNTPDAQ